jgi:hypothetical protein
MFVGHLAIGLGLARVERRVRLGTLFGATLLLDALLGVFVLLGVEHARAPAQWSAARFFTFDFPWSHGLLMTCVWAALFALAVRSRVAFFAVASHFVLDAIDHVPELPIALRGSPVIGLSLWRHMPVALALEVLLVIVGLALYLPVAPRRARIFVPLLMAALTALTLLGQLSGDAPPPTRAMAFGWIAQTALLALLGQWLDAPSSRAASVLQRAPERCAEDSSHSTSTARC